MAEYALDRLQVMPQYQAHQNLRPIRDSGGSRREEIRCSCVQGLKFLKERKFLFVALRSFGRLSSVLK
jgi:hypothetical protein